MSRVGARRCIALAALATASAAPESLPHGGGDTRDSGRLLVHAAPQIDLGELLGVAGPDVVVDSLVTERPLRALLRSRAGGARSAAAIAAAIESSGLAVYAVAERFLPMELRDAHMPDDPLFPQQWHLHNDGRSGRSADADVDAPQAWAITQGSPEIIIAVLDDGVQADHPDLAANMRAAGRDFTVEPPRAGGGPQAAADRHGTAAAGVAAARGDNGLGVSGVCPRCSILSIRVHGASNLGTAAAFRYAVEQGASIISNSWGYTRTGSGADEAVRDAIDSAAHDGRDGRGAVVVFGVTNDSIDNCSGPSADIASLESVLAVGVSNHDDEVGGSGFGTCLDLVAPAKPRDVSTSGIVTTDRTGIDGHTADDYYASFGGTSAAAPAVAGAAGLLLSLNPLLTRADVQGILEHTADKIDPERAAYDARGFSVRAGYGRLNAARALVPNVTITVTPARIAVGEPFAVTVTASAPFGVESLWWSGTATGQASIDSAHRENAGGRFVHAATWSGLSIAEPGTFAFGADARDARHDRPLPGYPHGASSSGHAATAEITVVEHRDGLSR